MVVFRLANFVQFLWTNSAFGLDTIETDFLCLAFIGWPYLYDYRLTITLVALMTRRGFVVRFIILLALFIFYLFLAFFFLIHILQSCIFFNAFILYHNVVQLDWLIVLALKGFTFFDNWTDLQILNLDVFIVRFLINCIGFNIEFKVWVDFVNFVFAFAQI